MFVICYGIEHIIFGFSELFCPCLEVHLINRLLQSCNIYYNIHTVGQPNHFYEEHRSCNVVLWLMCLLVYLNRQTYFQDGHRSTQSYVLQKLFGTHYILDTINSQRIFVCNKGKNDQEHKQGRKSWNWCYEYDLITQNLHQM